MGNFKEGFWLDVLLVEVLYFLQVRLGRPLVGHPKCFWKGTVWSQSLTGWPGSCGKMPPITLARPRSWQRGRCNHLDCPWPMRTGRCPLPVHQAPVTQRVEPRGPLRGERMNQAPFWRTWSCTTPDHSWHPTRRPWRTSARHDGRWQNLPDPDPRCGSRAQWRWRQALWSSWRQNLPRSLKVQVPQRDHQWHFHQLLQSFSAR